MKEILLIINLSLFQATLRMATPIALGALGGLFCERAGVINIALEGIMLTSAFFSVFFTFLTQNPWIGLLGGILSGVVLGFVIAILTVKYYGNQIVVGTGINIFGLGFSAYMCQKLWGSRGASEAINGLKPLNISFLNKIPIIGQILNNNTIIVYIMILLLVFSYFLIYYTPWGLRLRAVGENPQSADTAGINVHKYKMIFVILGSTIASLGGTFLSIGHLNLFAWGMTNGRGFIALAAMIFGKWNPLGIFLSSLLFGFADAFQMRVQALGLLPSQIILLLPYLFTILILAGVGGKTIPPSDYKPYIKD